MFKPTAPQSSETTALISSPRSEIAKRSVCNSKPCNVIRQATAITAATLSAIPPFFTMPKFVMTTVVEVVQKKTSVSWQEVWQLMTSGNWSLEDSTMKVFGWAGGAVAIFSLAPFNAINNYRAFSSCGNKKEHISYSTKRKIANFFLYAAMQISGSAVGFRTDNAYMDMCGWVPGRYPVVLGTIFFVGNAGYYQISQGLFGQIPRDFRYFVRFARSIAKKTKCCKNSDREHVEVITAKQASQQLRYALDDIRSICKLQLNKREIEELACKFKNFDINNDELVSDFFNILRVGFPMKRFIGAEIGGAVFSAIWSLIGERNDLFFSKTMGESIADFLSCPPWLKEAIGDVLGYTTFAGWSAFYFFLIREKIIYPLVRNHSSGQVQNETYSTKIKRWLCEGAKFTALLIPALSISSTNIALTLMNQSIETWEKIFVGTALVLQSTALSISGLMDSVSGFFKKPDYRQQLLATIDSFEQQIQRLTDEQIMHLYQICSRVKREPYLSIGSIQSLAELGEATDGDQMSIGFQRAIHS